MPWLLVIMGGAMLVEGIARLLGPKRPPPSGAEYAELKKRVSFLEWQLDRLAVEELLDRDESGRVRGFKPPTNPPHPERPVSDKPESA